MRLDAGQHEPVDVLALERHHLPHSRADPRVLDLDVAQERCADERFDIPGELARRSIRAASLRARLKIPQRQGFGIFVDLRSDQLPGLGDLRVGADHDLAR